MANKLLNASDFFKGGYNFLAPTDAWEKSDDTILRHRKATRPRSKVQNGGSNVEFLAQFINKG